MSTMRFLSLVFVTITACAGSSPPPPAAAVPSSAENLPVAQYLGSDHATGERVLQLLRAAGIEASAGGSLGYSVWVSGADRAKARQILRDASEHDCLAVTLVDDQGAMIEGTPPARCTPPTPPPVQSSKK